MSNFRTEFEVTSSEFNISYKQSLFFIGSCFTEHIGKKLSQLKFNTFINPYGILYNPLSIHYSISRLLSGEIYTEAELMEKNRIWHSFDHHSLFSSMDKEECLHKINETFLMGTKSICNANVLFITFGSAHYYQMKESQKVVSNCHKYPSSVFDKKVIDLQQTFDYYKTLFEKLMQLNSKLRIILTVSPIRYLSDGFIENQVSKSLLILLCNQLQRAYKNVTYFPAFEIMMDDLRDYRFYAADMIHPNQMAVDYIFEKFTEQYFDEQTKALMDEIEKIIKTSMHRVFFKDSFEHIKLCETMLKKIENLKKDFPFINFDKEIEYFNQH